jgi:hypothetical protein
MWIYTLKLESDKYYVGKTNKAIDERFIEHVKGIGSTYTSIFKPIEVFNLFESNDDHDENKQTLKMMEMFGIDNVRGGAFVSEELTDEQMNVIKTMIISTQDKCFNCGRSGHFVNECKVKKTVNENVANVKESFANLSLNQSQNQTNDDLSDDSYGDINDNDSDNNIDDIYDEYDNGYKCYRCGKYGHYAKNCYINNDYDDDGDDYDDYDIYDNDSEY